MFLSAKVWSQAFYSVKPDYLKVKTETNNLLSDYKTQYPDTSIDNTHNFFPRNFMGNLALSSPNYIFNFNSSDLGFRFHPTPMANDLFSENQIEYYRSKGPYADITGITGSKQLQALKLLFTHTYKERVNITLRLNRYSSQGFYLRQQSFANNFYISSNYTSKKKNAGYYFYFLNNGNRNQENGGLRSDTLSDSLVKFGKNLLPIKISSASRDNKEYKVSFNPWFKLNSAPDSLNKLNSYLQVKSKLSINTYKYKDAYPKNDQFYNFLFYDSITKDSSRLMKFVNEVNYSLLKADKTFGASVGYKNEINQLWQRKDSLLMNNSVTGDLVYRKPFEPKDSVKSYTLKFENALGAQYIFNGSNSGNYKIENKSGIRFKQIPKTKFFLNLMAENRSPDYIYNYWNSNNFIWYNNGFKPQQTQQAQLGIEINKKAGISFIFQNINNYLFFDQVALPAQLNGAIQNVGVTAFYSTILFKHLGISLQNTFQSTSSAYVNVPQNIATVKLFYAGSLFKNNLQLHIGAQGQAYQSFYANAYMPATQVFYLQDRRTTGNYPFVDVYLNARIRPVTIFVKIENALFGFAGTNYSLVPGYYQPDRAFRLGLSWVFFD